MERMEHFQGARLFDGDQLLLEDLNGHLGHHTKPNGRKQWFGYFELRHDQHIEAGMHYRLELADGRTAELTASDVRDSEPSGTDVHAAEFYVVGELHGMRRGLSDDTSHRHALG